MAPACKAPCLVHAGTRDRTLPCRPGAVLRLVCLSFSQDLGTPSEKIWPGYNDLPAVKKMTFTEYPYNNLRKRFGALLSDQGFDLMNKCVNLWAQPLPRALTPPPPPPLNAKGSSSPRFLTYFPGRRVSAEDGLKHEYFRETPLPIDPSMFPTWPAKSEQQRVKRGTSPRPPEGGLGYSQLVRGRAGRGGKMWGLPEARPARPGPHSATCSPGRRRPEGDRLPPHDHQPGGLGRRPRLQPQVLRSGAEPTPAPWGPPSKTWPGPGRVPEAAHGSRPRPCSAWSQLPQAGVAADLRLESRAARLVCFSTFYFILACKFVELNHIFLAVEGKAVFFRMCQTCRAGSGGGDHQRPVRTAHPRHAGSRACRWRTGLAVE